MTDTAAPLLGTLLEERASTGTKSLHSLLAEEHVFFGARILL